MRHPAHVFFRLPLAALVTLLVLKASLCVAVPPIKTMSFNIKADFNFGTPTGENHAWISSTGGSRRDLVTTTIQQFAPDILGVQEAFLNQMDDLTNALPGYARYGIGRNNGNTFGEHSGIFFRTERFLRANQGTFWLSLTPDQVSVHPSAGTFRIASWVILQDTENDNQEYFVLNSHWATGFNGTAAREHSAQLIRDRIDQLAGDRPLLVMGDLNAFDFQPAMRTLLGEDEPDGFQLRDSYRQAFPNQGPDERTNHGWSGNTTGQRIDYLLHSDHFRTESVEIVHTDFNRIYPSDHYPITATFALAPKLAGDFNGDGTVDAADYTVWRDGLGTNFVQADYGVWVANFGATTSVSSNSVPEPNSILLLLSLLTLNPRRTHVAHKLYLH